MHKLRKTFFRMYKKIPAELKYTLLLFFVTRIILVIIGVVSRILLEPYRMHSKHLWLDIWRQWDSGWYMNIAKHWYVKNMVISKQCNYGFFPFYPLLIRVTAFFVKDIFLGGLIVSNLALMVTCIALVKLVKLEYDQQTSLDALKFMFLFPTAFILSGVFSESLYLAFALLCFYYAKKERWALVGMCGFFLSLTRPDGLVITLPLFYLYLKQRNFSLSNIRPTVLFLLLVPLGTFAFAAYTRYRMGDWFAYMHAKKYWDIGFFNPIDNISCALFRSHNIAFAFGAGFSLVALLLLTCCYRLIGFAYWFFGIYTIILPIIFNGVSIFCGVPRYTLAVFPLFIILAILGRHKYVRLVIMIILALLQGFLMVFWANGFRLII